MEVIEMFSKMAQLVELKKIRFKQFTFVFFVNVKRLKNKQKNIRKTLYNPDNNIGLSATRHVSLYNPDNNIGIGLSPTRHIFIQPWSLITILV